MKFNVNTTYFLSPYSCYAGKQVVVRFLSLFTNARLGTALGRVSMRAEGCCWEPIPSRSW